MRQEQGRYSTSRIAIFIALIVLLLIVIFLIWWWLRPGASPDTANTNVAPPIDEVVTLPPQVQVAPPVTEPKKELTTGEAQVLNLARNFTERYGSWSTDSSYQNLKDLYPSVTSNLKKELDQTIAAGIISDSGFRGAETRVINMNLDSYTQSRAQVTVTAQQVTTDTLLQESVSYRQLELSMLQQGGFWYVDSAQWKQ
ncbi:MAG: hypothetical protein A3B31_01650 [Candidatus Komeilibacteria bacterium RIFCSPLOWO2_01_FULL_53_11]|uniref:Uncharacterized protein n=1 Tax=Candidatus Komeilibacteria bacterium RIFCSPLOWO2_01_FULL_53_11 TaxID=1798552 RepID=A0A1G2BUD8_9BACT|nr:MAG: hypothetical protein A3B31_01650 [Candidatus Komeilibacteria bacterium RIFCSPLOWO2_01_FULL_53_11]